MKKLLLLLTATLILGPAFGQKPKLNLVQIATGFTSPVDIRHCGDGRIFVVEQRGIIRIMDRQGHISPTPFLDISARVLSTGNEQGLLSLAFSPDYKHDSCFYVNYIAGTGNGNTVISRFKMSNTDSNIANPNSERVLLTFSQPYTNHKGATLMFGRDGYLYDTQGDGGSAGDPQHNGQNKNTFLGKMLRLDVSHTDTTYVIPAGNPLVGQPNVKPEIWAYGLRNPWRCAVDRLTGDIWIGDVGQDVYEEVDFQPYTSAGGENYGWRCYEGSHMYDTTGCVGTGFTLPIYDYAHSTPNGCSIIGGYVYRGAQYSRMYGRYFFTDYCSGRFWSVRRTSQTSFAIDTLASFLTNQYSSFGEDNLGELYIAGRANGRIYHITDTSSCAPVALIAGGDTIRTCDSVTATAQYGDSLSYQWYTASGAVSGASSAAFTTTQSGWYRVLVSGRQSGCQALSDSVYLQIGNTPITDSVPSMHFCNNDPPIALQPFITSPTSGGVFMGSGVANNILDPSLVSGTDTITYIYTNGYGCLSTKALLFNVDICTGIKDVQDAITFTISPNPNQGSCMIAIKAASENITQLNISDALGRICMTKDIQDRGNNILLDLSGMAKGIYTVQIKSNKQSAIKRMIVD